MKQPPPSPKDDASLVAPKAVQPSEPDPKPRQKREGRYPRHEEEIGGG